MVPLLLGNMTNNFGYFLFKHLVTLVVAIPPPPVTTIFQTVIAFVFPYQTSDIEIWTLT